jgi:hypothetical protein
MMDYAQAEKLVRDTFGTERLYKYRVVYCVEIVWHNWDKVKPVDGDWEFFDALTQTNFDFPTQEASGKFVEDCADLPRRRLEVKKHVYRSTNPFHERMTVDEKYVQELAKIIRQGFEFLDYAPEI